MSLLCKLTYIFNAIPVKILVGLFGRYSQNDSKFHMEKQRNQNNQDNLENDQVGRLTLPDSKTQCEAVIILMVWHSEGIYMQITETDQRAQKQTHTQMVSFFYNSPKAIQWGEDSFFKKRCWNYQVSLCKKPNLDPHLKSYTKMNLQWMIDLNIISKIIKLPEEKMKENLSDIRLGKNF